MIAPMDIQLFFVLDVWEGNQLFPDVFLFVLNFYVSLE